MEFILKVLKIRDGSMLQYASDELKSDRQFILKAIKHFVAKLCL